MAPHDPRPVNPCHTCQSLACGGSCCIQQAYLRELRMWSARRVRL